MCFKITRTDLQLLPKSLNTVQKFIIIMQHSTFDLIFLVFSSHGHFLLWITLLHFRITAIKRNLMDPRFLGREYCLKYKLREDFIFVKGRQYI